MNQLLMVNFEVIKNDRKYVLVVPNNAPLGEVYDSLHEMMTGVLELSKQAAERARPLEGVQLPTEPEAVVGVNMASKNAIKAIPLTSVASTALTGSFQILSANLGAPCHLIKIINNSDADVFVSYDRNPVVGSKIANDFVPKGTVALIPPYQGYPNTDVCLWSSSTPVFILGTAGMTGSVYLAGYYQGV